MFCVLVSSCSWLYPIVIRDSAPNHQLILLIDPTGSYTWYQSTKVQDLWLIKRFFFVLFLFFGGVLDKICASSTAWLFVLGFLDFWKSISDCRTILELGYSDWDWQSRLFFLSTILPTSASSLVFFFDNYFAQAFILLVLVNFGK